jgi:site-specific DNA recombinase
MRLGYARVSTASGEQLDALERQLSRLRDAGAERIIQDVESGLDGTRAGWLELLELIDRRAITAVVATRVDRLGRDAAAVDGLIALAARKGVALEMLDGGTVEASSPTGFLMARLSTSLAEVESRMLSMRVRRGLAEGRKQLRPLRGKVAWGYRLSADKSRLEPDPVEFERAHQFLALLESLEWRMNTALAQWDGGEIPLHSCRAVRAWLLNPTLRGGLGYRLIKSHRHEEVVWNLHPPLLSHDAFAVIERVLAINAKKWGKRSGAPARLLAGLVRCRHCGYAMSYAGSRRIPAVICRQPGCIQRYKCIHEAVAAAAITAALRGRALDLAGLVAKREPPQVVLLRQQISAAQALNLPALTAGIEQMQQELSSLQSAPVVDDRDVAALADPLFWQLQGEREQRLLFLRLVECCWVGHQQVAEVALRF